MKFHDSREPGNYSKIYPRYRSCNHGIITSKRYSWESTWLRNAFASLFFFFFADSSIRANGWNYSRFSSNTSYNDLWRQPEEKKERLRRNASRSNKKAFPPSENKFRNYRQWFARSQALASLSFKLPSWGWATKVPRTQEDKKSSAFSSQSETIFPGVKQQLLRFQRSIFLG